MSSTASKVALITGAGRRKGIGAAIARRLARDGVSVVLADLCAPPADHPLHPGGGQWAELQAIAEEIAARSGVKALPVQMDVTDPGSVAAVLETVTATFGRLDILVNNAGVVVGPAPVLQMDRSAWLRTIEVNLTGMFYVTQIVLPLLLQTAGRSGHGRIVNMSSLAATHPKPFLSAYAASKAGVIALTQSLAQEVAPAGITVNALLPGDIDTDFKQWGFQVESMVKGQELQAVVEAAIAQIPVGRIGTPEDVAAVAAFLCSEEADFITGQAIRITGGRELVQTELPSTMLPSNE